MIYDREHLHAMMDACAYNLNDLLVERRETGDDKIADKIHRKLIKLRELRRNEEYLDRIERHYSIINKGGDWEKRLYPGFHLESFAELDNVIRAFRVPSGIMAYVYIH